MIEDWNKLSVGGNVKQTVTYCAVLKVQSLLKSIYCNVDLYNITV